MDKYIGRLLDNRYEILEVIGSGGMAVVYKARCHRLNRLVAIKILKDDYLEDEDFRRRFHAESQAVAMFSHPNIVSIYDVSTSIMADYIVMELIDGISLKQYMEKKGVLNWKETLHFALQIAKALEHAHSRGIVHRDIKPHNVMVLKNGSVKVTDFGIARMMSKGNTLTKETLGSVHYISPEQAKGDHVDNRSDIYSLGVVMYEMICGRPPYDADSPVSVAIQHINGGAPMPSTLNPNIPGGLEQIIMRAMAHDPSERYASATEMLADMDEFRKNPSILFDYNTPPLEAVTRIQTSAALAEQLAAKETSHHTPERVQPRPTRTSTATEHSAAEARRRREEVPRDNRVATIAIVSCSIVAVLAIGIFLVALFSGGILAPKEQLLPVPDLLGKEYATLGEIADFEVKLNDEIYDDAEAGTIIRQEPLADEQVQAGNVIYVTVSKGPVPQKILMKDLTELMADRAKQSLNDLDLDLEILEKEMSSDTVPQGCVIRTEPEKDTELTSGQKVTLWISSGKEVVTAKMPDVVGSSVLDAVKMLKEYGFGAPELERVESNKPKDEVISQSVLKNTEVDVTTNIVLKISKGQEENTPPEKTATKNVTYSIDDDLSIDNHTMELKLNNKVVKTIKIEANKPQVEFALTGKGKQIYEVWIDGVLQEELPVDFNETN